MNIRTTSNILFNGSRFIKAAALWLLCMLFSNGAHALEYECNVENDRRYIRLDLPGETHLCEVSVTNSDNMRKVMWYANHDSLFCTEKTNELKNKYETKWGFNCQGWPDRDGVDQLSERHRNILDAELKFLRLAGQQANIPYTIQGVKAVANAPGENLPSTLVVQFFLNASNSDRQFDKTHVIVDDGVSWNTLARIDLLAEHIKIDDELVIDTALVNAVNDAGALEISTVISRSSAASSAQPECYGVQILGTAAGNKLVPRSPHRYVCSSHRKLVNAENAGG